MSGSLSTQELNGSGMEGCAARWTPPAGICELARKGHPDLIAMLVQEFAADAGTRLARLREAMSAGNLTALRKEAHSIKGSASQMGALPLLAMCQMIEVAVTSEPFEEVERKVARLERLFAQTCREMDGYVRDSKDSV